MYSTSALFISLRMMNWNHVFLLCSHGTKNFIILVMQVASHYQNFGSDGCFQHKQSLNLVS